MKDILKVALFLAIVCLLSAATLAKTFEATKDIIAKNEALKLENSLKQVIPSAVKYETTTIEGKTLYIGVDASGVTVGSAMMVAPEGYSAAIKTLVGMSKEGEFTSYIIQDMSETPGLGTKATEPKFKDEFDEIDYFGSNPPKVTKDGGQVDSISGATISSRAICNGVGEALQFTLKHKETIMNFNAGSLPVQKEGE